MSACTKGSKKTCASGQLWSFQYRIFLDSGGTRPWLMEERMNEGATPFQDDLSEPISLWANWVKAKSKLTQPMVTQTATPSLDVFSQELTTSLLRSGLKGLRCYFTKPWLTVRVSPKWMSNQEQLSRLVNRPEHNLTRWGTPRGILSCPGLSFTTRPQSRSLPAITHPSPTSRKQRWQDLSRCKPRLLFAGPTWGCPLDAPLCETPLLPLQA